jgi:hypothetical protein
LANATSPVTIPNRSIGRQNASAPGNSARLMKRCLGRQRELSGYTREPAVRRALWRVRDTLLGASLGGIPRSWARRTSLLGCPHDYYSCGITSFHRGRAYHTLSRLVKILDPQSLRIHRRPDGRWRRTSVERRPPERNLTVSAPSRLDAIYANAADIPAPYLPRRLPTRLGIGGQRRPGSISAVSSARVAVRCGRQLVYESVCVPTPG